MRDASYVPSAKPGIFPKDAQGFNILVEADTSKQATQWQRYEVEFAAPAARTTLAFVTTKRPPECGSCGSLLDAVTLQKGELCLCLCARRRVQAARALSLSHTAAASPPPHAV